MSEQQQFKKLTRDELTALAGEELPERAAMSLVNANVAAPINAALALNVASDNSMSTVVGGLQMAADADTDLEQQAEGMRMARDGAEELRQLANQLHTLMEPVFKASPIGPMPER